MKKRIETATSRTAKMTCLSRAASALEMDVFYKSGDFLAPLLLPDFFRLLFHIPLFRRGFMRSVAPRGIYEYVIARTKYIDVVFQEALEEKLAQILIFGAGFDTRALRFVHLSSHTRIFELDAAPTQQAKIGQYRKRHLDLPPNLTFIPIDFNKEVLSKKLIQAGFKQGVRSLVILEGVLMYLTPGAVDKTMRTIRDFIGHGSRVVFDFVHQSVLDERNSQREEMEIKKVVADAGEQWQFGIETGKVADFLKNYDLNLVDLSDHTDLEKRFFTDPSGHVVVNVNGSHSLVTAEKV